MHEIPAVHKYATYPIIALKSTDGLPGGAMQGDPKIQGTAAMLTHDGVFITAAHCVNRAFGEPDITGQNAFDPSDYALWVMEYRQKAYAFCRVLEICISSTHDVAFGRAEPPSPSSPYPDILGIGTSRLGKGSAVFGMGYPETAVEGEPGGSLTVSWEPRCYKGKIEDWDPELVQWNGSRSPGYRHSSRTPHGFSGGPLVRKRTGLVHGIMTGGYGSLGGPESALDVSAFVDHWEVPLLGGLTLREFARRNPGDLTVR